MPAGKTIAECLQALGVLERHGETQTKKQWPQNAKNLSEAIVSFARSIEEESHAHGTGESLGTWIGERVAEWVQLNGERWSAKNRSMLLSHAPTFPEDAPIIIYWVHKYVVSKWDKAVRNRKKSQAYSSLPGIPSHETTAAPFPNDGRGAGMRKIEQVSFQLGLSKVSAADTNNKLQAQTYEASSESHDLDEWDPYQSSGPSRLLPNSAAAAVPGPFPIITQSLSNAIVSYRSPNPQTSQANDPSQEASSSTSAANDYRSRTYDHVTFEPEMYRRTTFLIRPSNNRDGHTKQFYGRIMGLEEAQKPETFRAGVLERLREMGEVIGTRKLVAKAEWLAIPFVVENDHDHYYLIQQLRAWGKWKEPIPCIVYVSLEHEV